MKPFAFHALRFFSLSLFRNNDQRVISFPQPGFQRFGSTSGGKSAESILRGKPQIEARIAKSGGTSNARSLLSGTDAFVQSGNRPTAIAGVRPSLDRPFDNHSTNVIGTMRLLEHCRIHGIPHFVFASSSSVYGPNTPLPAEESNTPDPCNPYALTKLQAEQWGKGILAPPRPALLFGMGTKSATRPCPGILPPQDRGRSTGGHQWGWKPTPRSHPCCRCLQGGGIGPSLARTRIGGAERGNGQKSLGHGDAGQGSESDDISCRGFCDFFTI